MSASPALCSAVRTDLGICSIYVDVHVSPVLYLSEVFILTFCLERIPPHLSFIKTSVKSSFTSSSSPLDQIPDPTTKSPITSQFTEYLLFHKWFDSSR